MCTTMPPPPGAAVVRLCAVRPLPPALLAHISQLAGTDHWGRLHTPELTAAPTGPALFAAELALPAPPSAEVAQEIRSTAYSLGCDCAIIHGPLAAHPPGLVVTDGDSTFLDCEVIDELADFAGVKDEVAAITHRAMEGELDFAQSLRMRVRTLAGLPAATLTDVAAALPLMPGARELVTACQANGTAFGIVSGGFTQVLAPLVEDLGITYLAANTLEVDGGGPKAQLTGAVIGRIIDPQAKVDHLQAWAKDSECPMENTVAVGDGANDLPMLARAGLGIGFGNREAVAASAEALVRSGRLDQVALLTGIPLLP